MARFMRLISVVLIALLVLSSSAFANNNAGKIKEPKKKFTQEELEQRHKQIDSIMLDKRAGKISEAEALGKLAEMNVYPIKTEQTVTTESNPNYCIYLTTPLLYMDYTGSRVYAQAEFYWNAPAYWQADFPSPWTAQPGIGVNIGGKDGFGMTFNKSVTIASSSFYTFDRHGNVFQTTYPSSQTTSGVGYTDYDIGVKLSDGTYDYTWDNGFLSVYFTVSSTSGLAGWSQMSHTWDASSVYITGISYPLGISWDYYNQGNGKWDIVGPTGYYQ